MRKFDPWIGSMYPSDGIEGVRLLVLGESHYGSLGDDTTEFTKNVVRRWAQTERHRFFTTIQMLVQGIESGSYVSSDERAKFWELVAFCNYVQEFVGENSRERPTESMWREGAASLLQTLSELEPHLVLVCGKELAGWLPKLPDTAGTCVIAHPTSFGFSQNEWRPGVEEALSSARRALCA